MLYVVIRKQEKNCWVDHCCLVANLCLTLWPRGCGMVGFPVLHYFLEFAQTHVHWVSDAIQPSHPLSPASPQALNLSQHQGLFHWVNWSFSISPSNEYSGLISFRTDWFDILAVQGTLKSLFQHHNSKVSVLWCSAFFMIQLTHPYMTSGNTIALTIQTFVSKVRPSLFNTQFRSVIVFLPRSKCLLISWLQSLSSVILEPRNIKSVTASTFSLSICHEVMGPVF